jgi:hypothetical protein
MDETPAYIFEKLKSKGVIDFFYTDIYPDTGKMYYVLRKGNYAMNVDSLFVRCLREPIEKYVTDAFGEIE